VKRRLSISVLIFMAFMVSPTQQEAIGCCVELGTGDLASYIALPHESTKSVNVVDYGGDYEGAKRSFVSSRWYASLGIGDKTRILRLLWVSSVTLFIVALWVVP
jgi:hypothetical protein